MDFLGRCRGQIKVEISPEISTQILRKKYHKELNNITDDLPEETYPKTNILHEESCESTTSKNITSLKMPLQSFTTQ